MTYHITYSGSVISNPDSLASILGIPLDELTAIAEDTSAFYRLKEIEKKNPLAGKRLIHIPSADMKKLLRRVNSRIFKQIHFPEYLFGSISDEVNPRDYIRCAALHCRASVLIKIDIKDFFPSITQKHVNDIFTNFFNFSDSVSDILSKLVTVDGVIPQGAPTSSFIANLCFFDFEPSQVSHLTRDGFRYSRLIDDITISHLDNKKPWKYVQDKIQRKIESKGFVINAEKSTAISNRSSQKFKVHGLCIGEEEPKFSRSHANEIKDAVRRVVKRGMDNINNRKEREFHQLYYSVQGKTTKLKRVNNPVYPALKKALNKYALPLPDDKESTRLKVVVKNLERDYPRMSEKLSYRNRYYKAIFRLGVLSRLYKRDAQVLKQRLTLIQPNYEE
ncbi:reverse transcriptase family protein [Aeromonas veronii]